ncbi:hypothetical protein ACI65C_010231 [Semiaphis heraclei]
MLPAKSFQWFSGPDDIILLHSYHIITLFIQLHASDEAAAAAAVAFASANAAENLVVQPAFSSSRKLYYYIVYRGKEKTVTASAVENTIPPGVRKSMVGRRRFRSPAVADARTPPPRTGDPFDRNSTHTPARTFIPIGRRIVADAVSAEFPTPLSLGIIVLSYTFFFPFSSAFPAVHYILLSSLDFYTGRSEPTSISVYS